MSIKKPPIGLIPKHIHAELRLREVKDAIIRYIDAGLPTPKAWSDEYEELIKAKEL